MERKVIKLTAAAQSHGRGMDNTWKPARYGVYHGDELILTIDADAVRQYERAEWDVCDATTYRRIKTFDSFRAAKEWALTKYSMPLINLVVMS